MQNGIGYVKAGAIDYTEQAGPLPSLFVGLWLADGSRDGPLIANDDDEEMRQHLEEVAALYSP